MQNNNQRVTEVTGRAAQAWGNILIPSNGNVTVKVVGDTLQATVRSGLEKKESWTRIQNVDSIEILEAPIYPILALGASISLLSLLVAASSLRNGGLPFGGMLFMAIGAGIIAYSIIKKRRYLAIYSHRYLIPVFMNKTPETYQQFALNVLAIARQLSNPPMPQPRPVPPNATRSVVPPSQVDSPS